MKRQLLISVSILALSAVEASAADMVMPVKAAPLVAATNWTGFYVGGHVGYAWGKSDPFFGGKFLDRGAIASQSLGGITGGGQVGFNWQFNDRLVAGIETDLSYLHANQNSLVTYTGAPLVQTQVSTAYHWFGTTRGRLGYLVTGATMIYATGGLAYARIDHSAVVQTNPTVSETSTRTGWTVGGGVEYALNAAWSVKGEYL